MVAVQASNSKGKSTQCTLVAVVDSLRPRGDAAYRGKSSRLHNDIWQGYRGGSGAGAGAVLPWPMTLAPTVVPRLCVPSDSPLQRACTHISQRLQAIKRCPHGSENACAVIAMLIASCALFIEASRCKLLACHIFSKEMQQLSLASACEHQELRAGRASNKNCTSEMPHSARRRLRRCAPPPAARPAAPGSPLPASAVGMNVCSFAYALH